MRFSTDEMSFYVKTVNNLRKSGTNFVLQLALEFLFVGYPE